jgi:hypothetical protein
MIHYRPKQGFSFSPWIALLLLMIPAIARANIGPSSFGGHIVADPIGVIGIAITHETLTINLRPLATNNLPQVEALYHFYNSGAERTLELLFASGSANITDFLVWLDAKPILNKPTQETKLPVSWQPPPQTPGISDGSGLDYLSYGSKNVTPIGFTVTVPPGSHDLKVRYTAEASTHLSGYPTVYRQFAYVLAPARAWSNFGGLDVTIHIPEKWRAACTPTLARTDGVLKGSFAKLPADAIALTLQKPEGWAYHLLAYVSLGLLGLIMIGGAVICWRCGRLKGRRLAAPIKVHPNWLQRHTWPTAFGLGIIWGIAILIAGLFAIFGPEMRLPHNQLNHYGYRQTFAMIGVIFIGILAVPIGFMIAQLTAIIVHHRDLAKMNRETGVNAESRSG